MPSINLESLPYDIFLHTLTFIDDKGDLDNVCLALPNSAAKIVAMNPRILDTMYWMEIQQHFLLPVALLNFRFHKSLDAAAVLKQLRLSSSDYLQEIKDRENGNGNILEIMRRFRARRFGNCNEKYDPKENIDAILEAINQQMAKQMKNIHIQVEKLASIFIQYKLRAHHPLPEEYTPPTPDERRRIIQAVYRASLIDTIREENTITYETFPETTSMDRPIYSNLLKSWGFWDLKETAAVMDVLWTEIPKKIIEEASGGIGKPNGPDLWVFESKDYATIQNRDGND
ncbi:hypothetical protein ABW20_dc0109003 [Dactylellina cionopaga]|nr:hypothetical protein ABW20_dc0109003 [Dactylellina cionopaga]